MFEGRLIAARDDDRDAATFRDDALQKMLERDLSQADAMLMEARSLATRKRINTPAIPAALGMLRFHENKRVVLTASNDQVRRPMFTSSVERWRKYEKHLGPLKEALGVA